MPWMHWCAGHVRARPFAAGTLHWAGFLGDAALFQASRTLERTLRLFGRLPHSSDVRDREDLCFMSVSRALASCFTFRPTSQLGDAGPSRQKTVPVQTGSSHAHPPLLQDNRIGDIDELGGRP
jgi:hypothetical protein